MWLQSSRRSQLASSMVSPSTSKTAPRARELASTQRVARAPETSHRPRAGSLSRTLYIISFIMSRTCASLTSSSHADVTAFALLFTYEAATLNQPQTGRWLTSRPQSEKILLRVGFSGSSPTSLSRFHIAWSPSSRTRSPSTRAPPPLIRSAGLHSSPFWRRCASTYSALATLSSTKISSMYGDAALRTFSSRLRTAATTFFRIWGAAFNPNPSRVRQKRLPPKMTVWYVHKDL